jgi:Anti-sigma factor NepR
MLTTDTLSPEDSALIEREAGSALKALYAPLVHEPLPDRFAGLLEQLAVRESVRDRDDSRMWP